MKESPIFKSKPFSVETIKQSIAVISSSNNTQSKMNISCNQPENEKRAPQNLRNKVYENVHFEESNVITSTNTKNEQISNATLEYYSGNSNNKSNVLKSCLKVK